MERLRDQGTSSDPIVARAADLLSAVPPIDAERMGRPPRLPPAQAARRGVTGLRLALVGAVTLATVVAAAAAGAHRAGLFGTPRGNAEAIADSPAPVSPIAPPSARQALAPAPTAAAPEAARVESAAPSLPSPHRSSAETPHEAVITPSGGESVLMVQAVRALRHDNDPTRAQALAEEALRRYPKGPQVEEAMVLSMEAAAARGDAAGAQRAAERYLARFPSGRFADRARLVLGGS
jgi:hypothetical protein